MSDMTGIESTGERVKRMRLEKAYGIVEGKMPASVVAAEVAKRSIYGQTRMTKAYLLELIKDYPDDTPIVVDMGGMVDETTYAMYKPRRACAWAVANDTDAIVLEL